jgi:hypothetical protein
MAHVSQKGGDTMRILMKSMMAGALVSLAAVVASGSTIAAPCGSTTLDVWLVSGFSCTVGDKTFSNFFYQQDGFNGTLGRSNVPATSVGVGPAFTTAGPGIGFNAFWNNAGTTSADALLRFMVTAPANTPIVDFHLLLDGVVGSVLDVASLSNGVTLSSSDNLEHAVSFAPVTSLFVTDDIGVNPGGTISSVEKQFSQVPGPVVGAGLPGLIAACGGLVALARRRRKLIA